MHRTSWLPLAKKEKEEASAAIKDWTKTKNLQQSQQQLGKVSWRVSSNVLLQLLLEHCRETWMLCCSMLKADAPHDDQRALSRAKLLYHMILASSLNQLMMLTLANVFKASTSIQNHTTSLLMLNCLELLTYFLYKLSWSRPFPHCSWNRRARWAPPRPSPGPKNIHQIMLVTSSPSLGQSVNRLDLFEPSWSFWVQRRRTALCSSSDPASELPGSQTAPPSGPSSGPKRW